MVLVKVTLGTYFFAKFVAEALELLVELRKWEEAVEVI